MSLTHTAALLTLATPNFDRLVSFYQHLLTLEPVTLLPNVYAEFQLPGVKLGIFRPKEKQETGNSRQETAPSSTDAFSYPLTHSPLPTPYGMSLCLEVTDLEAAIAHLTQLACPPIRAIMTASHGREVYAYDPDGNWLILHQSVAVAF